MPISLGEDGKIENWVGYFRPFRVKRVFLYPPISWGKLVNKKKGVFLPPIFCKMVFLGGSKKEPFFVFFRQK
jgi:hypothetical protein